MKWYNNYGHAHPSRWSEQCRNTRSRVCTNCDPHGSSHSISDIHRHPDSRASRHAHSHTDANANLSHPGCGGDGGSFGNILVRQ